MSFISNLRQAFVAARAAEEALSAEAQAKAAAAEKAARVGLGNDWELKQQEAAAAEKAAAMWREKGEVIESLKEIDKGILTLIEALHDEECLPHQLAEREAEWRKESLFVKEAMRQAGFPGYVSAPVPTPIWQPASDPSMDPWDNIPNTSI